VDFPPGKGGRRGEREGQGEKSDDDRLAARIVVIAHPICLGRNPVDSRDRLSIDDGDDSMFFCFEALGGVSSHDAIILDLLFGRGELISSSSPGGLTGGGKKQRRQHRTAIILDVSLVRPGGVNFVVISWGFDLRR